MKITLTLHIRRGKKDKADDEPQPAGDNVTNTELSGQHTTGHLDADDRPGNYGRRISMRAQE